MNAKEIAEKIAANGGEPNVYELALAYLELRFEVDAKQRPLSEQVLEMTLEIAKLKEENAKLKEQLDQVESPYCSVCGSCGEYNCCEAQSCKYPGIKKEQLDNSEIKITELSNEIAKLREALEFYANCKEAKILVEKTDEEQSVESLLSGTSFCYIEYGDGKKAREALKEGE